MSAHPTNHASLDNIQLHQSVSKSNTSPVQQSPFSSKKLSTINLSAGFYKTLEDQTLANPLLVTEHNQRYQLFTQNKLGQGSFGQVYLGVNLQTDEKVAIKIQNVMRGDQYLNEAKAELNGLRLGDQLIDSYIDEGSGDLYSVMPYYPGVDLSHARNNIKADNQVARIEAIVDIAISAFQCVAELHQKGLLHRDLKCENIIWDSDSQSCHLVDYAKVVQADKNGEYLATSPDGTVRYMAPELCSSEALFSQSSEAYAMGMLLFTLLADKPYAMNDMSIMANFIKEKPQSGVSPVLKKVAPEFFDSDHPTHRLIQPLKSLIMQLMDCDRANRLSVPSAILQLRAYKQSLSNEMKVKHQDDAQLSTNTRSQNLLWQSRQFQQSRLQRQDTHHLFNCRNRCLKADGRVALRQQ